MYTLKQEDIRQLRNIVIKASDLIFEIQAEAKGKAKDDIGIYDLSIEAKGFGDYVTAIDLAIQTEIEQEISNLFPHFQFLGEEGEDQKLDFRQPCIILDPIDGTTNLIRGMKHSSISLAYYDGEKLTYGGVYNPFLDEYFEGVHGQGAYLIEAAKKQMEEGTELLKERITGSPIVNLRQAIIMTGTCPHDRGTMDHRLIFEVISDAFSLGEDINRTGSAALDLSYLAAGRADIFFEAKLRPWDFAGGIVICQEAGLKITDFRGNALSPFKESSIFCASPNLYDQFHPVLDKLRNI